MQATEESLVANRLLPQSSNSSWKVDPSKSMDIIAERGFKCEVCGKHEVGIGELKKHKYGSRDWFNLKLQVHHIEKRVDRPDLVFDELNMLVCCGRCHRIMEAIHQVIGPDAEAKIRSGMIEISWDDDLHVDSELIVQQVKSLFITEPVKQSGSAGKHPQGITGQGSADLTALGSVQYPPQKLLTRFADPCPVTAP